MAKRLRLLIYEADEQQLEFQRQRDGVRPGTRYQPGTKGNSMTITSIELDPRRITLLELLRLFWREARHKA